MSKSLGNLVLVRDLLRTYSGDAIRHFLVSRHYRSEVHFSEDDLERLGRCRCPPARGLPARRGALARRSGAGRRRRPRRRVVADHRARFLAAMDDDLDTPAAIPELEALARLALSAGDPRRRRTGRLDGPRARSPHSRAAPGGCARGGAQHDGGMTGAPDDDLVPISVRLGEVVPPEDPGGLDASTDLGRGASACWRGRSSALAWFVAAPPSARDRCPAGHLSRRRRARGWRGGHRRDAGRCGQGGDRDARRRPVRRAGGHHPRRGDGRGAPGGRRVAEPCPCLRRVGGRPVRGGRSLPSWRPSSRGCARAWCGSCRRWGPEPRRRSRSSAGCFPADAQAFGVGVRVLDEEAGRLVLRPDVEERRIDHRTSVERERAAWVEATSGRDPRRIGGLAAQDDRRSAASPDPAPAPRTGAPARTDGGDWRARRASDRAPRSARGTSPRSDPRRRRRWTGRG